MRQSIEIDLPDGKVSVVSYPTGGLGLAIKVGEITISFGLTSDDARKLGKALVRAADETQ